MPKDTLVLYKEIKLERTNPFQPKISELIVANKQKAVRLFISLTLQT